MTMASGFSLLRSGPYRFVAISHILLRPYDTHGSQAGFFSSNFGVADVVDRR